jgi:hypothetical protein
MRFRGKAFGLIGGIAAGNSAIPISKRKSQEMRFLRAPVPKPIYNFTPIRNFGAFAA